MKKISVLILATLMVIAYTAPVLAFFESEVGGYWRTRVIAQENFNGTDAVDDVSRVDTRTRFFYTAHFSENFKFVNKFEMDAVFGDESENSYGDIGTDGVSVEVKNSYVDFTLAPVNFKIGAQGKVMSRGFLFDDDFAGAIIRYMGEENVIPFIWIRAYEGGPGRNRRDGDVDYFALDPRIKLGESTWVNPVLMYITSNDAEGFSGTNQNEKVDVGFLGLNVDSDFDFASLWLSAIYEYGSADIIDNPGAGSPFQGGESLDVSAWLGAIGGSVEFDPVEIHGEFFYASGDDDPDDDDAEAFFVPKGQSYYWSEIMGLGVLDNQPSAGSPGDQIGNVWAANLGVSFKPMEKLKLIFDVWYAEHPEDDLNGEKSLGTEVDARATYTILENLDLDLVGAYLFAGDATAFAGEENDKDPYEFGLQLSFRF